MCFLTGVIIIAQVFFCTSGERSSVLGICEYTWHGSRSLWAAQFPLQDGFVWLFSLFKEVITDSWSVFLEVPDPLTLSRFASFNNGAAVRSLPVLLRLLGKIGSIFSDSERWEHVFRPAESLALIFFPSGPNTCLFLHVTNLQSCFLSEL